MSQNNWSYCSLRDAYSCVPVYLLKQICSKNLNIFSGYSEVYRHSGKVALVEFMARREYLYYQSSSSN